MSLATVSSSAETERRIGDYGGAIGSTYRDMRRKYDEYMHVTREELGLASRQQTQQLKEWIESINPADRKAVAEAEYWFEKDYSKRLESAMKLHEEFIAPLREARKKNAISEESFKRWIAWVRNPDMEYKDKEASARSYLPAYLKEREALAADRADLLKNTVMKDVASIKDPGIRGRAQVLPDDHLYFDTLEFSQRRNLVDTLRAALKSMEGGIDYKTLFDQAKAKLDKATEEPQPALHRDKVGTWLKRILESKASLEDKQKFVNGNGADSLDALIKRWRLVAVSFWTIRADDAFEGVKTDFINTKKFLALHYNERLTYVEKMSGQRSRARQLRMWAKDRIARSSFALGPSGVERWLDEYLFNGKLTLEDLSSIISGEMTTRLEQKVDVFDHYKKLLARGHAMQAFRGKTMLSQSAFLNLHYRKQLHEVDDLEKRLDDIEKSRPDFLEIRHFMDRKGWEEALELIEEAKRKPDLTEPDRMQLSSMEVKVRSSLQAGEGKEKKEEEPTLQTLSRQVDDLIDETPSEFQTMCRVLCGRGAKAMGAANWASYNRDWCNQQGYLDYKIERGAIEQGKHGAKIKGRRNRLRGVYHETIQGETGDEEYIDLSPVGPTNVCVDMTDSSAVSAFIESMWHHRDNARALYWTNAIFHRNGNPIGLNQQNDVTQKMYKMRNLLRKIEAKKGFYQYKVSSRAPANVLNN